MQSPHILFLDLLPASASSSLTIKKGVTIHQQFSDLKEVYSKTGGSKLTTRLPRQLTSCQEPHHLSSPSVPPSHPSKWLLWMNTSVRPWERISISHPHYPHQKHSSSLKKGRGLGLCIDYKGLNKITIKRQHTLPPTWFQIHILFMFDLSRWVQVLSHENQTCLKILSGLWSLHRNSIRLQSTFHTIRLSVGYIWALGWKLPSESGIK